ncbi:DNA primase [Fundicoccus sp. Sow4_H7]|uniref:DNA primase n=1 Tax=Fundicoccus sp. Sow4_H7 TaxID=3438784 RepID=UPI003F8FE441
MQIIPDEVIQEIRQKTDIVDVINQYVQLTKRGNSYTASCPFHEDRNPSFSVQSQKQIFKCFSCGRGGNVFGFLQEIEGISFPQAVKKAAEMSNISVDAYFQSDDMSNKQLQTDQVFYNIHEKTAQFYQYYLNNTVNGEEALEYLLKRNLSQQAIEDFAIGYAPNNSQLLLQFLKNENFKDDELIDSGIFYFSESNNQLVDRFRGRLIFPLRNTQGKVVAFSGRVFSENTSNPSAKYLNSPETSIFQKNQLMFNFDRARLAIRQSNQALICEGFMDVIALDQAGFNNSIATMGTSLTESHLKQLTKLAKEIIFVFDGDDAGQKATARAFEMSLGFADHTFKSLMIPQKLDPDEWIKQHGSDSFQKLINQALNAYEFQMNYLHKQYDLSNQQELAWYIEALIKLIAAIQSPIEQQLRLNNLVQEFNLSEAVVKEQLAKAKYVNQQKQTNESKRTPLAEPIQVETQINTTLDIQSQRAFQAEKIVLACLIYNHEAWQYVERMDEELIFYHEQSQQLYFELQHFYYDLGYPIPLTDVVSQITSPKMNHFLTTIIWEKDPLSYSDGIMDDCLNAIREEFVYLEIDELKEQMLIFRKEQKINESNALAIKIMQLTRQLKSKS